MLLDNDATINHFSAQRKFLPVLAMDWFGLLRKAKQLEGEFGILAPFSACSKNFLQSIRETGKPFFLDSAVFENKSFSWHEEHAELQDKRWVRTKRLCQNRELAQKIKTFLDECNEISPDYVFAPDVFGEPLLSLHLARLAWEEYACQSRNFTLIGVVQMGDALYNWPKEHSIPQKEVLPPHYQSSRSFLISLISEYRNIGYQYIALGGLLKNDSTMPTGLKFGLSSEELDSLLTWSRPDFVLGGLALSRLEVLKKHNVWADSTNWLWWDSRYDKERFGNRNILQEVVGQSLIR
jgi:hypothetical protein